MDLQNTISFEIESEWNWKKERKDSFFSMWRMKIVPILEALSRIELIQSNEIFFIR